jgi:hypothetical protein
MTISRMLAAALAIAAIAVPATAQAQPADLHDALAQPAAPAQSTQDLRSPDARDAGRHISRTAQPQAPTWPVDPKPVTSTPAAQPADTSNGGVDWTIVLIGIAGVLIAVGGVALVVNHRHSPRLGASV